MEDKKLPKAVIAQIKKTCKLMADNNWLISFDVCHTSICGKGHYAHVSAEWLHEMFEEHNVTKLPQFEYEYHWAEYDGVVFYCGIDVAEEADE